MTEQEIKTLIDKKIYEHIFEMQHGVYDMEQTPKEKTIESATKHMIIKDKILFHKSCAMVLTQLLEEINGRKD